MEEKIKSMIECCYYQPISFFFPSVTSCKYGAAARPTDHYLPTSGVAVGVGGSGGANIGWVAHRKKGAFRFWVGSHQTLGPLGGGDAS